MLFQQNGTSLWYGTPDAPAPQDAVLATSTGRATGLAVTVGVRPIGARTTVEVRYRVNGGAGLKVQATLARTDIIAGAQYFVATLPEFRIGDKVDYGVVALFPGIQVPNAAEASNYSSSFHIGDASARPVSVAPNVMALPNLLRIPTLVPRNPSLAAYSLPLMSPASEWQVSGRLINTVDGLQSFAGCRVEAFVERVVPKPHPVPASILPGIAPSAAGGHPSIAPSIQTHSLSLGPATTAERVPFRASALSDAAGHFVLSLPLREQIAGERVTFIVSSPVGKVIGEKEVAPAQIGNSITIDVLQFAPTTLPKPSAPAPETTRRIRGRLIERSGKPLAASVQVLLLGRVQGASKSDSLSPILVAKADGSGYFTGEVPNSKFDLAVAVVAGIPHDSPIRLEDGFVPASLPLVVELPAKPNGSGHDDCRCSKPSVPRTPTQENIMESPGTFSADLGTGQCIHFNVPNRAIEEFNFYSVVRTTQPDIVGLTTGTVTNKPAPIQCLPPGAGPFPAGPPPSHYNPVVVASPSPWHTASPVVPPVAQSAPPAPPAPPGHTHEATPVNSPPLGHAHGAAPVSSPPSGAGAHAASAPSAPGPVPGIVVPASSPPGVAAVHALATTSTVSELATPAVAGVGFSHPISVYASTAQRPDVYASRGVPRPPGRATLDWRAPIDWDSTPTFYEAASIAHGHLLHFKQVWYADGYSLGDLLYSLPLGPGQKKLISIVDWERREQTTRAEDTTAGESLQASLSRDRDLSEVVTGALSESSRGGSRNTTVGAGAGTGAAGNGSYQQFNFGALLGVSGGIGESDSSAFQESSRNLSTSSLQNLRDRTLQSASAIRNLRSTLVQTARQGEAVRATTEVVANHNHCHALTIQYFEVLRHLKVAHELADVQECLFVPLPMSEFDRAKALRWRQPLSTYLQRRELAPAFDATRRVETCWSEVDTPAARYADELVSAIFGELTLTIFIPLPPLPEKPKPDPAQTGIDTATAVAKALNPTEGFLGAVLAVATGGVSLLAGAATSAATDVAKATTQGARAMAESLYNEQSPEERYKRFQQEVMPAAAAGFVDQLELYALVGANEINLSGADFTLVSEYQAGTPLLVSVRGHITTPISRADISALIVKSSTPLPPGCRAIVNSASLRYQSRRFRHDLVNDSRVNDDIDLPLVAYTEPVKDFKAPSLLPGFPTGWVPISGMVPLRAGKGATLYTPLDEWEQRAPRIEDIRLSAELLDHLNANLEYYHHAIWWTMDPNRRFMLLDGYIAPNADGRSVASVVDNSLIGIVGNALVLPVARGNHLDPQFKLDDGVSLLEHYAPQSPAPPSRVSLPTRGVFAEAVMGDCNACEKIDDTRFWRWEESPIDQPPTLDAAAIASRRNEPNYGTPTPFPSPIVSIQNAPAAPDPTGVKAALDTLTKQSFADITGLAGTQANAAAAYSKAVDTALQYGKEASTLAQQAAMINAKDKTLGAIDNAEQGGKIDSKDAKDLRVKALRKMVGDTPTDEKAASVADRLKVIDDQEAKGSITKEQATTLREQVMSGLSPEDAPKNQEKSAATETIRKIPGDAVEVVETKDPSGATTTVKAKPQRSSGSKVSVSVVLRAFVPSEIWRLDVPAEKLQSKLEELLDTYAKYLPPEVVDFVKITLGHLYLKGDKRAFQLSPPRSSQFEVEVSFQLDTNTMNASKVESTSKFLDVAQVYKPSATALAPTQNQQWAYQLIDDTQQPLLSMSPDTEAEKGIKVDSKKVPGNEFVVKFTVKTQAYFPFLDLLDEIKKIIPNTETSIGNFAKYADALLAVVRGLTPTMHANLTVHFFRTSTGVDVSVTGTHGKFPSYELYVNGKGILKREAQNGSVYELLTIGELQNPVSSERTPLQVGRAVHAQ